MWKVRFPIFLFRLGIAYLTTCVHLVLFRLATEPLALINVVVTLIAGGLAAALLLLPSSTRQIAPTLNLAVQQSREMTPVFLTVKTSDLINILEEQERAIQENPFPSQSDFVNLAVLAHKAGYFEKAQHYYKLARHINPNMDFFAETR